MILSIVKNVYYVSKMQFVKKLTKVVDLAVILFNLSL